VGQAGDRAALCVERVAVNIQDARIPDNDGARPTDAPVVAGGPAAYLSTLPVRAAVAALRAAELPAQLSMSAGTFVCNHVFYGLMHLAATRGHAFRGGFLHVPCLPQQAPSGAPGLALDDIVSGIAIVLEAAVSDTVA
jgi:pyroglutamyl-peptidase